MSLYNALFGKNPDTATILASLGLEEKDVERFRDCGITDRYIYIYTRTGGVNRAGYRNEKLTSNPYYIYDHDDPFYNTYATYIFRIPLKGWIKTADRIPDEYEDGEQVFTLPTTLKNGEADFTWTRDVGDDPERYPYWMPVDTVLGWLTGGGE